MIFDLCARVRRAFLAFLAGLWNVDQCEGCSRPITGEPYSDVDGVQLCAACWPIAQCTPERVW